MPYITREDGERFIIPSYRDVLSAKKQALLKKEILLLSTNYGEYITLQRKNVEQYEAAFSPEPGYLLGETVWHHFKRPRDLIYCEAIPNTTEAILVIVKGGSVYLDGSFAIDSIPDELIVFRTQQNNFEIYIHGDIPLSQSPEEGKFSLDASSVKSFSILPQPIFPILPTIKTFQLRLVDVVLKSQGIGVFPVKRMITGLILLGVIGFGFMYLSTNKQPLQPALVSPANPHEAYMIAMSAPPPDSEIKFVAANIALLYTIPGWTPISIEYSLGSMKANVKSPGTKINILYKWAPANHATIQIASTGIYVSLPVIVKNRPATETIEPLQRVIAEILDRVSSVIPGNNLRLATAINRGEFSEAQVTINFTELTLETLNLLAEQLKGLPLVLVKLDMTINNGTLSGAIVLKALGN